MHKEDSNTELSNENLLDRIETLKDEVAAGKRADRAHTAIEVRLQDALDYFHSIVDTVREPMLVLDEALRVRTASQAFYDTFAVSPEKTIGKYVYDLGNGQWGIPNLRTLLEEILPKEKLIRDFEIDHDFPMLGRRVMLLNAGKLSGGGNGSGHVLLAIEDITERKRAETCARCSPATSLHRSRSISMQSPRPVRKPARG